MGKFTYAIKTMGCKANIYDSLLIERELQDIGGLRGGPDCAPDLFVLNSCTVTAEADRQAHREVNQVKKHSPETWTLVTGCLAQVATDKVRENANVDQVLPNDAKSRLQQTVAARFGIELASTGPDPEIYWGQLPVEVGKTRAFVKIQEGCNDFCTYCIIPYARGKSRSVRTGLVLAEVQRLADLGVHEVVLTGTNIGDFGLEFDSCLEELIEAILERTSIPRLRLTSLDPSEITDRILNMMGPGSRLMPHFHVSLQSPVSRVLRAMKRDYRTEEVIDALNRIHQHNPEIFVGMDVIAGFPSETDAEHREGMEVLERLPWTRLHVFPYSEREGTPATRIPGSVAIPERRKRAAELSALSKIRHEQFVGRFFNREVTDVLFENWYEAGGDYFAVGHAANYLRVMARVPSRTRAEAEAMHQRIGRARIVGASPKPLHDWTLEGVLT
ncbi:MAG: MiaB/RimO family radical SAM methylthiotransferase [Deltaproteobacteria bacterium]|nr:MiaB/RimO family radical SAM methylthiotransferase [Deltaproteobacteria bacterium]